MSDVIVKTINGAVHKLAVAPLEFTEEQRKMIRDSFLSGATEQEAAVLLELARMRRLNPITQQIHFVKRWNGDKNAWAWAAQVAIDGFRSIAERTGLYDGQDEPEITYSKEGQPLVCKVRVYRRDWTRPAVGVAHFHEFAQKKKDGSLTHMWASKPHVMIAKCAEAQAFRKAFPEDMAGIYSPEEMPDERDVTPEESQPVGATKTDNVKALLKAKLGLVNATPVAEEPPPPTEADYTPTAEEEVGQTKESTYEVPAVFVPFGKNKGLAISALSPKQLGGYVELARKELADESKTKFHTKTIEWLAQLNAELGRR